jgi:hypothetical protein
MPRRPKRPFVQSGGPAPGRLGNAEASPLKPCSEFTLYSPLQKWNQFVSCSEADSLVLLRTVELNVCCSVTLIVNRDIIFQQDKNDDDWITRYFFTGGTMPSANLLLYFQVCIFLLTYVMQLDKYEYWLAGHWSNMNVDNYWPFLQEDVSVVNHWLVSGTHYARTRYAFTKFQSIIFLLLRFDVISSEINWVENAKYFSDLDTRTKMICNEL